VDHSLSPNDLTGVAGDVESVVLARAVHWLVQHRVLTDGQNTVLFE
jgi:formyltetrahydrofolate deformylase